MSRLEVLPPAGDHRTHVLDRSPSWPQVACFGPCAHGRSKDAAGYFVNGKYVLGNTEVPDREGAKTLAGGYDKVTTDLVTPWCFITCFHSRPIPRTPTVAPEIKTDAGTRRAILRHVNTLSSGAIYHLHIRCICKTLMSLQKQSPVTNRCLIHRLLFHAMTTN